MAGLNNFAPEDRPHAVQAVFQFYHLMVGIGGFLLMLIAYSWWRIYRGNFFETRWLLWVFVFAVLLPQIANQVGWYTAEMGRQPWVVYKLLRTSDALSAAVTAEQVLFSLILFTAIYLLLFLLFIYLLNRKIQHGPDVKTLQDARPKHQAMAETLSSKNEEL